MKIFSWAPVTVAISILFLGVEAKEPSHEYRFDRYSGVPVMHQRQAESIIRLRHVNAPMVGEVAPDSMPFDAATGERVSLYELIGEKPLVLIFGSSSCNNLDLYLKDIPDFYERFSDVVDFAFVYIREAHPEGGFLPEMLREDKVIQFPALPDATTLEKRREHAVEFQKKTSMKIITLADSLDDEMAVRWGAWPERIFVISKDRKVIYSGGPGPWYFWFTEDGWHTEPPASMKKPLLGMPFSRSSLERFLQNLCQP